MPPGALRETPSGTVPCRDCGHEVSSLAKVCPQCGAPRPGVKDFKGDGYEYKSTALWMGYPVVHIAFGSDERGKARMARGVIAIGVNAMGGVALGINAIGFIGIGINALGIFALGVNAVACLASVGIVAVAPWTVGIVAVGAVVHALAPIRANFH